MATDHRGRDVHAGKRTTDETIKYPTAIWIDDAIGMHLDFEQQHGRRMTRREHNEAFTPPSSITYDQMDIEDSNGQIFSIPDESKPKYDPIIDYPYTKKTQKKGVKAINPPPKRFNKVSKVKGVPKKETTEEERASRDTFW